MRNYFNYLYTLICLILPSWVLANPQLNLQLNLQCTLQEASGNINNQHRFEMITLSDNFTQSAQLKTGISIDPSALYTVNLTQGDSYQDATGEEIGADYYISLIRLQNKTVNNVKPIIKGSTQDMLMVTIKQSLNNRFNTFFKSAKREKKLEINYEIKHKKIRLLCEIF